MPYIMFHSSEGHSYFSISNNGIGGTILVSKIIYETFTKININYTSYH